MGKPRTTVKAVFRISTLCALSERRDPVIHIRTVPTVASLDRRGATFNL